MALTAHGHQDKMSMMSLSPLDHYRRLYRETYELTQHHHASATIAGPQEKNAEMKNGVDRGYQEGADDAYQEGIIPLRGS